MRNKRKEVFFVWLFITALIYVGISINVGTWDMSVWSESKGAQLGVILWMFFSSMGAIITIIDFED